MATFPTAQAGDAVSDLPFCGEEAPSAAASPGYGSHIFKHVPARHLAAPHWGV